MDHKIAENLVEKSYRYWNRNIKTSFLTFLSCKMIEPNIETPFKMGKFEYNQFINRFLTNNGQIYNPCTNRYPKNPEVYYGSLSSYTRFQNFLWYDNTVRRGYFKIPKTYIDDVKMMFIPEKLNIEYVSIWLFRNELWSGSDKIENVINKFIETFSISKYEVENIFSNENQEDIKFETFQYKRIEKDDGSDQLVLPIAIDLNEIDPPERKISIDFRVIRDTFKSFMIKRMYDFKCQLCDTGIVLSNNQKYAEAHHIKPLAHNGPDIEKNILCVCPNCHVKLDYGAIQLDVKTLNINPKHKLSSEAIEYHNEHIYKNT